jgi:tetratricopeptide (TPR) repeat protein
MLGWFDAKEASKVGTALADAFKSRSVEELLRRADKDVRPLRLNFFKRAQLANAFKWRLIEDGVEPSLADSVTQSLVMHLATPAAPSSTRNVAEAIAPRKIDSGTLRQMMAEARRLAEAGKHEEAAEEYRIIIESEPNNLLAHTYLGAALVRLGRYREAEQSLRRAVEIKPDAPEAHCNLGNVLRWKGELSEAERCYRQSLKLNPSYHAARTGLGLILAFLGRLREARARFDKVLKSAPRNVDALVGAATVAKLEGRFKEAEAKFNRALEVKPTMSSALSALVSLRKMTAADAPWLERAQHAIASGLSPLEEADLRFAIGKYHDDLNEYPAAFESYQRANELLKTVAEEYDSESRTRFVDEQIRVYDRRLLSSVAEGASSSSKPVLVVGMMRSGTSLVEQIIASHPAASGAGELTFWGDAATTHAPEVHAGLQDPALRKRIAEGYLRVLEEQSPQALRVVDKSPLNFNHLGMIHRLFPNARIIYLQRDPIDTCLSCYFQQFTAALNFCLDLRDLAHYYQEHVRLMRHWREVLPAQNLLEVPYEGLITDQETWTRRILEFIDLPWDARCLDFHATDRSVTTASAWQVRQKLYSSSVGRWRHYEKFIGPLKRLKTA